MHRSSVLFAVAVAAAVVGPAGAAQMGPDRTVEQFKCRDVMREPDHHRDIAIAFLHGYVLGKSGGSAFNIDTITKQTSDFIDQCLDHPQDSALDVMSKIKK